MGSPAAADDAISRKRWLSLPFASRLLATKASSVGGASSVRGSFPAGLRPRFFLLALSLQHSAVRLNQLRYFKSL